MAPTGGGVTEESAFRTRFPEDEAREAWLALLLDSYAVLDAGVAAAITADGRRPACRSGCAACCRQPIPASSLEVLGLTWYAHKRLRGRKRRALRGLLEIVAEGTDCPFLVEDACAVYPLRPMACREFVMLGRPCRNGEQPTVTRAADLLPLPQAAQYRAFRHMLPFYGVTDPALCEAALRDKLVLRDTAILQGRDWSWLAKILV